MTSRGTVGIGPFQGATGDFNGDRKLDLVVGNSQSGNISVLLGDGNGGLGVSKDVAQGQGPRTVVVADVADASGDQKLDLLVGDLSGATVLLGNGMGGFSAATKVASGGPFLAVGDFNGDQKLDLVLAGGDL